MGKTHNGHVLVVDDDRGVQALVASALKLHGYSVVSFTHGAEAIEYYREHHRMVDMLMLDMVMPDMTGLELVGALKKINPNVPAVLSSGFLGVSDPSVVLNEIFEDLLAKPFLVSELLAVVSRHTSRDMGASAGPVTLGEQ